VYYYFKIGENCMFVSKSLDFALYVFWVNGQIVIESIELLYIYISNWTNCSLFSFRGNTLYICMSALPIG